MADGSETILRVAILAEEPLGWGSGKHYFFAILDGYQWRSGDRAYRMECRSVLDRDILAGRLTREAFDLLLVPGGGVGDGEAVTKGLTLLPRVRRWKRAIRRFVEAGGGYLGICGGAALATGLVTGSGRPRSLLERLYHRSAIGITCVDSYYRHLSLPVFTFRQRRHPERVGATAYVFSFSPGETSKGERFHAGGVPVDFSVSTEHAIFAGHDSPTLRMRWWGGPGLIVPPSPGREVEVLARYPSPDFSSEPRTAILAWRYVGGLLGLARAFLRSLAFVLRLRLSLRGILTWAYYLVGPWRPGTQTIDLDCAGRPAITAEVYPNEHQARILLCAAHPEYLIWHEGHIVPADESEDVCLGTGLHRWVGVRPLSASCEEELTSTWWVVRRMVAWTGRVPDAHLPPIERGATGDAAIAIIDQNVRWDGTLIDQMRNI